MRLGGTGQVTLGNRPSGQAIKAVKGYVGTTNRIGISLRDHAGIVAENVAKVVFVGMPPKKVIGLTADLTVTRSRWGHRDNPSLNELFRIAGIGLTTEFLGGEKMRARRSPCSCLREILGIGRLHFRGIDRGDQWQVLASIWFRNQSSSITSAQSRWPCSRRPSTCSATRVRTRSGRNSPRSRVDRSSRIA